MRNYFLLIALLMNMILHAQDPHFSQYYASQSTVNPATTGMFNGDMKVSGLYRQQWPQFGSAFVTGSMALEFKPRGFRDGERADRLAVGGMLLFDKTPDEILKSQHAYVMVAYHKALDENGHHRLGLGFMAGYNQKMLDATRLTFGSQFQSGGFTGADVEVFDNNKTSSFDVHSGVLYSYEAENKLFYAGASLFHLAEPKEFFLASNSMNGFVPRRWNVNAGLNLAGDQLHFAASFLLMRQHHVNQVMAGGAVGVPFSTNGILYAGSWFRMGESVIPTINLQWDTFNLGVSYDTYLGNKKSLTKPRSFELSLSYRIAPYHDTRTGCFAF